MVSCSLSDPRVQVPVGRKVFRVILSFMDLWLKHSKTVTYADDTMSSTSARQLEEDAQNVLNVMASNGLVANPKKTALVCLRASNGGNDKSTFLNDGIKAWNKLPDSIRNCKSLYMAKKRKRHS